MDPFRIHFSLFGTAFVIGPYELFFGIAIVTALAGCFLFGIKKGFAAKKLVIILGLMLLTSVIGARILYAIFNLSIYTQNPGRLLELSTDGFTLYGGIFMAIISGYAACRTLKINPFKLGDTFIPFLGVSVAIMRVGCFLNGCCFGQVTDLPWGVRFPLLSPAHLQQMGVYGNYFDVKPVHPTQLYELAAGLILSFIAFGMLKKKHKDGTVLLVFLTGFSLFRLLNSYLRVNPDTLSVPSYFSPVLYLSIASIGAFLLWRKGKIGTAAIQQTA